MGVLLILFLSMYTWNKNTHVLDDFSTDVGLELTGGVITPIRYVQDKVTAVWKRYVYLVDVNEKNAQLEARVRDLEARLLAHKEDMAELARLRELLQLPIDESWTPVGARVLAGHLGPNSLLDSITINRGYATGARPRAQGFPAHGHSAPAHQPQQPHRHFHAGEPHGRHPHRRRHQQEPRRALHAA